MGGGGWHPRDTNRLMREGAAHLASHMGAQLLTSEHWASNVMEGVYMFCMYMCAVFVCGTCMYRVQACGHV